MAIRTSSGSFLPSNFAAAYARGAVPSTQGSPAPGGKGPPNGAIVEPPGKEPYIPIPALGSTTRLSDEQKLALDIERINSMFGYTNPANQYRGATLEDPLTALKSRAGQSGSPFMQIGRLSELGDYGATVRQIPGTDVFAGFNMLDQIRDDVSDEDIAAAWKWVDAQAPDYLQAVTNYEDDFRKYGTPEYRAKTAAKNKAAREDQLWGANYSKTGEKSGGVYGDTLSSFLDEMNRQYSPTYANAATGFATRGMSGSLGDIATMGKLGEAYDRKRLGFTEQADTLTRGVGAKDEQARLSLLDDLNAGTDFSTAFTRGGNTMQANIDDAKHTATTTNLADMFRDFGNLYDRDLEVNAFNQGYAPASRATRSNSNYQGSVY